MKIDTFKDNFVDNIFTKRKLAKYTWFGVGGDAEILYIPDEEKSLEKFLKVKPDNYYFKKVRQTTNFIKINLLVTVRVANHLE